MNYPDIGPYLFINKESRVCYKADIEDTNVAYRIASFLHMMGGSNDLKSLSRYSEHIIESSDNLLNLRGAYGPRLRNWIGAHQLQEMINLNGDIDKAEEFVKPAGIDQMMAVFDDLQAKMNSSTMVIRDPGVDFDETDDVPDLTSVTYSLRNTPEGEVLVCYMNYQDGFGPNFSTELWVFNLLTQIYYKMLERENDLLSTIAIVCSDVKGDRINASREWSLRCKSDDLCFANTPTGNELFWEDLGRLQKLAVHIRFYLNESTFSNPDVSNESCEAALEKVFVNKITDPVLQDMAKSLAVWAFWTYGSVSETYAGDYVGVIERLVESMNGSFIATETKMFLLSQDIPFTLKLICE